MDHVVPSDLDLVGYIYDAVLEPRLWNDTVECIRRAFGLANASIFVTDIRRQTSVIFASAGIPERYLQVADQYDPASLDLWGGPEAIMRLPLEEPHVLTRVTPLNTLDGNSYYEAFGRPQGLVDLLALMLEFNPGMMAYFGMALHESMPPFNDGHIERLRLLAPHLRRAALISNLLDARADAAASFEAALNAVGTAVLLVDREVKIVYANARAEQQLRSGDPLASLNGRLHAPRELVKGQLERAVAATTQPLEMIGPGSGIPVRRRDGSGVIVHVLPLQRRSARPTGRAVAAVFVAEPSTALNLPLEGIRALYDLRPAETRVLELVAQGLSGRAVAAALGISENTAKTHTIRLFDKLGLHTRAELVRFARDMALG